MNFDPGGDLGMNKTSVFTETSQKYPWYQSYQMRISVAILTIFSLHFAQDIQYFNFTQIQNDLFSLLFLSTEVYYTVHFKNKISSWIHDAPV